MSGKAHNKKRNLGLLVEFLVRAASSALIEGHAEKSEKILGVLKRNVRQGTPLHREFLLFNSLMKVQISSEAVASTILREAKAAAQSYDLDEVNKQKTRLINEVNKEVDDPNFWDVPIPNYKVYATIGTLISEWRVPTGRVDIERIAELEQRLVNWLLEKKEAPAELSAQSDDGTNRLAFRLALKKFNDKYSRALLPEQKEIVRQWALSQHSDKPEVISRALNEVKARSLANIDSSLREEGMQPLQHQLKEVRKMIAGEDLATIDDGTVKRFMLYSKLCSEIATPDEGDKS